MPFTRWTASSAALFLIVSAAMAEEPRLPDPLFQSTEILDVRIVAPLTTLFNERSLEEELPATLEYNDSSGKAVNFDIQIRTRGRFRRKEDVCAFPPIRLNFKTSETKDTLFHKQDKVKLVTHCQSSAKYDQALLREYTAYRILNVLTDASFRVRLLRISYVDSDGEERDGVSHGFVIEQKDRLAKRLEKNYLDLPSTTIQALNPEHTSMVSMYHYLIGNTDFSPVKGVADEACCHNHELFGDEDEPVWSVPYDFDQAGFVDAPHASPNPRFNLSNNKQRLYRGRCVHNDLLAGTIAHYNDKQEEMMTVVHEVDDATARSERKMAKFIDKFYDTINSERRVAKNLVKECI